MVYEIFGRVGEELKKVGKGFAEYFQNIYKTIVKPEEKKEEKKEIQTEQILRNPNITYLEQKQTTINIPPPGTYTTTNIPNVLETSAVRTLAESEIKQKLEEDKQLKKEIEEKGQTSFFYVLGTKGDKALGYHVSITKTNEGTKIDLTPGVQHSGAVKSGEDLPMYAMGVAFPAVGAVKGGVSGLLSGMSKGLTYAYVYGKGLEASKIQTSEDLGKFIAKTSLEAGIIYGINKGLQRVADAYYKHQLNKQLKTLEEKIKENADKLVLYREQNLGEIIQTKTPKSLDIYVDLGEKTGKWKLGIIEGTEKTGKYISYEKVADDIYKLGVHEKSVKGITEQIDDFIGKENILFGKILMPTREHSILLTTKTGIKLTEKGKGLIKAKDLNLIVREIPTEEKPFYEIVEKTTRFGGKKIEYIRFEPYGEINIKLFDKMKTFKTPKIDIPEEKTIKPEIKTEVKSGEIKTEVKPPEVIPKIEVEEIPKIKPLDINIKLPPEPKTGYYPLFSPETKINIENKIKEKTEEKSEIELKSFEDFQKELKSYFEQKQKEKSEEKEEGKTEEKIKEEEKEKKEEKQKEDRKPEDKEDYKPIIGHPPLPPQPEQKQKQKTETKEEEDKPEIPKIKEPKLPKPKFSIDLKLPVPDLAKIKKYEIKKEKITKKEIKDMYMPSLTAVQLKIKSPFVSPILKPIKINIKKPKYKLW